MGMDLSIGQKTHTETKPCGTWGGSTIQVCATPPKNIYCGRWDGARYSIIDFLAFEVFGFDKIEVDLFHESEQLDWFRPKDQAAFDKAHEILAESERPDAGLGHELLGMLEAQPDWYITMNN